MLEGAFTADVDILLLTLYFACSDFSAEDIFKHAHLMTPNCLRVLITGRETLDVSLNTLMANLPDDLLEVDGGIECSAIVPSEMRDTGICQGLLVKFSVTRKDPSVVSVVSLLIF